MANMALTFNEPLDVFGQNPRLSRLYTQLCFCFPLEDTSLEGQATVVKHLKQGIQRLATSFPWTSGQVVESEDGIFNMAPLGVASCLTVKDLIHQLSSYEEFRQAEFPFRMLDETIIAPRNTLPERPDEPAPVLLTQANFVDGGLLLVTMGQHNCMDMAGLSQVISLLAKACKGDTFTDREIQICNVPRRNVIPIMERIQLERSPEKPTPPSLTSTVPPQKAPNSTPVWASFSLAYTALSKLKKIANETKMATCSFLSTDDVASAALWQAVSKVRLARLGSGDIMSAFERQVNTREHLDLPKEYPGMAVYTASSSLSLSEAATEPLGIVASCLRLSLNPSDVREKSLTAAAKAAKDANSRKKITAARGSVPPANIKMSSWAKEACYEFDFGGELGRPEEVRRPAFEAWDGLAYFLPKKPNGAIMAAICLRQDDLERLKSDETFATYARYVG